MYLGKKNRVKITAIVTFITLCFLFFLGLGNSSYATEKKEVIVGWHSCHLCRYDDYGDAYRKTKSVQFTLDRDAYVRYSFRHSAEALISQNDDTEEPTEDCQVAHGKIKLAVYDEDGDRVDGFSINTFENQIDEEYEEWFYSVKKVPAGTYTLKISGIGVLKTSEELFDATYEVYYQISIYDHLSKTAKIKKKVSARGGNWVKIGKLNNGLPAFKKIKSSNSKIVSDWWINNNDNIYVWARKKGKATVTVTLKNGKKYKTKVTVKPGDPDFFACLDQYKTRKNYFTVVIKNNGVSPLTIIRKGAKVTDKDYKAYDRKIKGSKNVVIKPGKTKTIKFYVKGGRTWNDVSGFTLHAHFKYEGKKYKWKTADNYSWYKRGKEWWNTFWNFTEYDMWE